MYGWDIICYRVGTAVHTCLCVIILAKIFATVCTESCQIWLIHTKSLQWRHDGCDGVSKSNHRRLGCLLKRLLKHRSKKTSKLRVSGLYEGSPQVTGGFSSQRASDAENVSIWWRHLVYPKNMVTHESIMTWKRSPHSLRWSPNGRDGVSNHQPHDCLLNRLFRRRSKKSWKLRVIGICAGNSPGIGEFPAQVASNAENVSISWRHHD